MSDLVIEFKNESFYGDVVEVALSAGELSRVGFELYYQLSAKRKTEKVLLAKAKTGMVCYDYTGKKVVAVSDKIKSMLQA